MSNTIGIIAEDVSDVEVVDELIKKVVPGRKYSIKKHVGHTCGTIQAKSPGWAADFERKGCTMLMVVHDLDDRDRKQLYARLQGALNPCPIRRHVIVIPIREIEAWLLTDDVAIKRAMGLTRPVKHVADPQSVLDAKSKLGEIIWLGSEKRRRYISTIDNKKIAAQLHLNQVRRCSSFVPLEQFVLTYFR